MIAAALHPALADEGMWMTTGLDGRKQDLCDCIVSFDFMGTGSVISGSGLVLTNHHVVYSDVFAMSSGEHNYLEEGYWARTQEEELPIPGRSLQFLKGTVEVTAEVQELFDNGSVKQGSIMAMRKLGGIMEKRYKEKTGYEAVLSSAWRGSRYYISLYEEYSDIRLVAAPPSRIGAFGGDVDNWEWPQHKGDFSLVRIYAAPDGSPAAYSPDNVPLKTEKYLKISRKGFREGTKTMIIGYPASTDRYAPSAKVDYLTSVQLPIQTEVRGARMEIIRKWMDRDPEVRRKYSDYFFSLSNAQELYLGELQCYKRFDVAQERRNAEAALAAWLEADNSRRERWGDPAAALEKAYKAIAPIERNTHWFRECIIRGTLLEPVASRTAMLSRRYSPDKVAGVRNATRRNFEQADLRVERELFRYCLEAFYENVDSTMFGEYQTGLRRRYGRDYDAMCAFLWDGSWISDPVRTARFLDPSEDMEGLLPEYVSDPLVKFFLDVHVAEYNQATKDAGGEPGISLLQRDYTGAMYAMQLDRKMNPYPDANSTMRINYGRVRSIDPRDAVHCSAFSTVAGLLEKHDPGSYDFCIPEDWRSVLRTYKPSTRVNFITDNDSTGGNSGSPVLNSKGEIIGLLFDGNKESLGSEIVFDGRVNRSVNVDIRYVLSIISDYGKLDRIMAEIAR